MSNVSMDDGKTPICKFGFIGLTAELVNGKRKIVGTEHIFSLPLNATKLEIYRKIIAIRKSQRKNGMLSGHLEPPKDEDEIYVKRITYRLKQYISIEENEGRELPDLTKWTLDEEQKQYTRIIRMTF